MKSRLAVSALLASFLLVAAAAASAPADERATSSACKPKKNLEAIIDDSGSMGFTDDKRLRVRALELLVDTPGNEKKALGGLEFGTDAVPLFGPGPIGPNRAAIKATLNTAIQADQGLTDYNDAFALAAGHNPGADGRIFLTDGGHNQDVYAEVHRNGPPVYVIGLGFVGGSEDEQRLQRIAAETGGLYLATQDSSELQAAMNEVNAAVNCQAKPVKYEDVFNSAGEQKRHAFGVGRQIKSVQFAISWGSEEDSFDIGGFKVVRGGQVVARGVSPKRFREIRRKRQQQRQRRKAKGSTAQVSHRGGNRRHRRAHRKRQRVRLMVAVKRRGPTFVTVRVRGVVPGKMRFQTKARQVSEAGTGVQLTTQASRSKRK